ncbi:ESX secretion-associated protein EspG [Lentzea sp. NBRC 105346]|uniref:ESX secretion-associated protein EspG n=1 Tax=Lentzea sp. NBRC 105346 TaxID=3032205 RepID=UPI0024A153CE|nr:ESX secretion-associated protein EspG [Lentzea sp. NBRC 105346]GLZ33274.1 ESX secretion-associated protein EspG [Lentzea sp. NBRC 105346]
MTTPGSVVLSTLEFDVAWEAERLPKRNVALDVPSPGMTYEERAQYVARAWESLEGRGLASRGRVVPELADGFALLANPQMSIDIWIKADRSITGVAAASGDEAILAVIDGEEVWLIEARATALAEAAVSVAGEMPAGYGRSISAPYEAITKASAKAGRNAPDLIMALEEQGIRLGDAQELAGMVDGMSVVGQFGVERGGRRADRVVAFHDNPSGRFLRLLRGDWCTVTPADNHRLASCIWELLQEV